MAENGVLKLEADNEGIWLSASSRDYTDNDVYALLKTKGVLRYDFKAIRKFLIDGLRCKVCMRNPQLEKDARIIVSVTQDKMHASVEIDPPFFAKPWPSVEDVMRALVERGIVYGLDKNSIESIVTGKIANEPVVVANGLEPVEGSDGYIELLKDPDKPFEVKDDERVDFWERSLIMIVHPGDEIARRHSAVQGTSGYNVFGHAIKPQNVKNVDFDFKDGLKKADNDPTLLVACVDGQLKNSYGTLEILPELDVKHDVDFDVGSIDFTGAVNIHGSVRENFKVNAHGNIDIHGTVEGADVSSDGNIIIHAGIRGTGKAKIKALGDITVNFVDQATMKSGGNIIVKTSILHSKLSARKAIIALGRSDDAQVIGGRLEAGLEVSCKVLGNEMGTRTEVVAGLTPEQLDDSNLEQKKILKADILALQTEIEKMDANLNFLKSLQASGELDEEKRATLLKLTQTRFQSQINLDNMQSHLDEIEKQLSIFHGKGIVRVKETCYPGVVVTVRGFTYRVERPCTFVSFVPDEDSRMIVLRDFNYMAGSLGGASINSSGGKK